MSDELKLFPLWKQAVKDFIDARFSEGDVITKKWLEEHFEMTPAGELTTLEEFERRAFDWLKNTTSFRESLLEEHQIALQTVIGDGYRVVPPHEQTALAREKFEKEARKSYKKAVLTMTNVQVDKLTDQQRKENTDAIAKLSMLRGMHKSIED
jgi:hypothetical protein